MAGDECLAKVRTLRAGVEAMRDAGKKYLPQEEREQGPDYDNRIKRSWLFPALDKAVHDVADRVFAREITFGEDVPEQIVAFEDNITNEGRNLNNFARDVFEDGVEAGISFILVDSPKKDGDLTRAQEVRMNIRPYLVMVRAEAILGWKTETTDNMTTLKQVRILETAKEDNPDNEFEQVSVEQVRVLDVENGRMGGRIFRQNDKSEWILYEEFLTEMSEITLVPFYTNRTGYLTASPPYENLADLNIAHWQSASDQRNILHTARVPLLMFSGVKPEDITSSSKSAVVTDNDAATGFYVEHTGAAIGAGRDDLKDMELRMTALGLQLMLPKTGNTTATGEAIDSAKSHTPLAQMANNLKEALEKALDYMAQYMGLDDGGSVGVNTDFGVSLLGQADLTFLLNAVNTGQISRDTFLREAVRRNVLMDGLDVDDEKERIDAELPDVVEMPGLEEDEDVDLGQEFLRVVNGGKAASS